MKANIYYRLTKLISATLMLTLAGCLGSGSGTTSNSPSNPPPSSASIAQLSVVDANKVPVGNGTVSITSATGTAVSSGATSNAGVLGVNLPSGSYTMSVTKGAATSTTQIEISSANANTNATVLIPAVQDAAGSMADISATAVVASIVGKITDATGPIAGATVSLSSATAATVASAVTDATGNYYLAINVSNTLADANGIFVGNLNVSKTGYSTFVTTGLQVSPGTNVVGLNYKLTQAAASTALYSENFETVPGACGSWTSSNSDFNAGWHPHGAGLGITNAAYTLGLVSLAPDDTSLGKVPDPIGGTTACWYGAANMGVNSDEQGNFMGTTGWNTPYSYSGGSSTANQGALISPVINLTAVPAGTDISLSFNTFWEIESVNPNNSGFDIMEVDYSLDYGATWIALARLNPLSDPSTAGVIRDPIPFSNTGYNSAPKWVGQEPIPLVDPATGFSLAGNYIMLRFAFNTVDGLFNGFRGWMIDDVAINQQLGTYPIMAPGSWTTFMANKKVRSLVK